MKEPDIRKLKKTRKNSNRWVAYDKNSSVSSYSFAYG